ncbi:MAG: hypothetical protein HY038_12070 [Nitrospirae bacterium]|nr:hypothetical protein [Nitrospirota bacterium]
MMLHIPLTRMLRIMSGLVLAVAVGAGCSGSKVTTKSSNELSRYKIQSIALMPFTSMATPQVRNQGDLLFSTPESVLRSDISMSVPLSAEPPPKQTFTVPDYAAEKVTQLFWKRLQSREGVRVLSPGDSVKAAPNVVLPAKATPETTAAAIAKELKVDAALIGQVLVYQERVGNRLGASPPASVGFEVKVVAGDGQVLWVGDYFERQRPMSEDLMGFLQRWAFVTAGELAEYGVDEIVKEFPFGGGE